MICKNINYNNLFLIRGSVLNKQLEKFYKIIEKLKTSISSAVYCGKAEKALALTSICARLLYYINQNYADFELEEKLEDVQHLIFGNKLSGVGTNVNDNEIIFYDGFGIDNRGLVLIYLKALSVMGRVTYVTSVKNNNKIKNIKNIITGKHQIKFIDEASNVDQIKCLKDIIDSILPKHLFLYTTPWDVVGISVFNCFKNTGIHRYQINLTDHAFWLGVNAFDVCLEFRDYGAFISNRYRNIKRDKIQILPYYPIINYEKPYEGFPFEFKENYHKVIFSGGSLYKTLGANNLYYDLVRHALEKFPETIFWYAGGGDDSQLKKLSADYPNRVFHTAERKDLYQVLCHCYLYLSTYPMVGGLMFQYAAVAGRVPLTLKYDDCANDCLINQDSLNVEFDTVEDFYCEMDKLLSNPCYAKRKGEELKKAVITPKEFIDELKIIMCGGTSKYPILFKPIDTATFQKTYIDRFSLNDAYDQMVTKKDIKYSIWLFPAITMRQIIKKMKEKTINKFGKKNATN